MPEIFNAAHNTTRSAADSVTRNPAAPKTAHSTTHDTGTRNTASSTTHDTANLAPHSRKKQIVKPIGNDEIVSPQAVARYSRVLARYAPATNPFAYFAPQPVQTCFESQLEGEHIVLLVRQHPISQLKWFFVALLLFFVPFLLSFSPLFISIPPRFTLFFMLGWYMAWSGFLLETFLNWFFNVNILTDERVIDIDFVSLLFQDVATSKLDNVEDVTSITSGTFGSIFDYGLVLVQTAGATDQIEFQNVPHPAQINEIINELLVEEEKEKVHAIGEAMQ